MGNSGGGIDWNPGNSPLFKGGVDWNPGDSTLGQAAQGNWGEAARGAGGGLKNAMNLSQDLWSAAASPLGAAKDAYQTISGEKQAAERHRNDVTNADAENARQQQIAAQNKAQADAAAAANQKNLDYQSQQAAMTSSLGAEDAFNRARNAARQAKGTALFGAYNG